jgi:hypothetical protein
MIEDLAILYKNELFSKKEVRALALCYFAENFNVLISDAQFEIINEK